MTSPATLEPLLGPIAAVQKVIEKLKVWTDLEKLLQALP
jgi:hypothetical protein